MPNHIKNRLEMIGNESDVQSAIEKFSTYYPSEPDKSHDGNLIYRGPGEYEYGWWDESTKKFTRRNMEPVDSIPEGFTQKFTEAWTRFPDFDKVIHMPESLQITSGSLGDMAHELLFGGVAGKFSMGIAENQKRFKEMSPQHQREAVDLAIKYQDNIEKYGHATWYDWSIENWGTKWNCYSCEKIADNIFDFETAWSGVPNMIAKISNQFPSIKLIYKYSDEDTGSNCGIGTFVNGESSDFAELKNQSKEAYDLAFELRPDRKENYKLVGSSYEYSEQE